MRNASGHQCKVKMSGSEKIVNENTYDISSIKCVTKDAFTLGSWALVPEYGTRWTLM